MHCNIFLLIYYEGRASVVNRRIPNKTIDEMGGDILVLFYPEGTKLCMLQSQPPMMRGTRSVRGRQSFIC